MHKIMLSMFDLQYYSIKGVLHLPPQKAPKLAYFVLYLKIINIFKFEK